jgi:hypothetical protein
MIHNIVPATHDEAAPSACLPDCCRNHVYVFLLDGMDPFDWANLRGVRDYVQSLGYVKTYYGQLYHASSFEKEIRRLHREDPDARFVLIGFSFGANVVCHLTQATKDDDVHIDLLVYLGGNTLKNRPEDRPENVCKLVNILATGCIWNGDTFDGAENVQYSDRWHFGSPSHPYTLDVLSRELALVAARVPIVEPAPSVPEEGPVPRRAEVQSAGEDGAEWDFLKPASVYGKPAAKGK